MAAGLIVTGTVLFLGRSTEGNESAREAAEHAESAGRQDCEHHGGPSQGKHGDAIAHGDQEHHGASKKGPHGGNAYATGDATVELGMAEDGGEPKLKLRIIRDNRSLVANILASGAIRRVTGESMLIDFKITKDSLRSEAVTAEPHVFGATTSVILPDVQKPMTVVFSKEENKIESIVDQIAKVGMGVEVAGAAAVQSGMQFPGETRFNRDRTAHMVPHLAGVIGRVPANIGEQVRSRQALAVIVSTALFK